MSTCAPRTQITSLWSQSTRNGSVVESKQCRYGVRKTTYRQYRLGTLCRRDWSEGICCLCFRIYTENVSRKKKLSCFPTKSHSLQGQDTSRGEAVPVTEPANQETTPVLQQRQVWAALTEVNIPKVVGPDRITVRLQISSLRYWLTCSAALYNMQLKNIYHHPYAQKNCCQMPEWLSACRPDPDSHAALWETSLTSETPSPLTWISTSLPTRANRSTEDTSHCTHTWRDLTVI